MVLQFEDTPLHAALLIRYKEGSGAVDDGREATRRWHSTPTSDEAAERMARLLLRHGADLHARTVMAMVDNFATFYNFKLQAHKQNVRRGGSCRILYCVFAGA